MLTIPNADPSAVRQFVKQDQPPLEPETADLRQLTITSPVNSPKVSVGTSIGTSVSPRRKSTGIAPVGLIPVTVRLRPELAGALKRASLERQLAGEESYTQQELVEQALEPWLTSRGYLG